MAELQPSLYSVVVGGAPLLLWQQCLGGLQGTWINNPCLEDVWFMQKRTPALTAQGPPNIPTKDTAGVAIPSTD